MKALKNILILFSIILFTYSCKEHESVNPDSEAGVKNVKMNDVIASPAPRYLNIKINNVNITDTMNGHLNSRKRHIYLTSLLYTGYYPKYYIVKIYLEGTNSGQYKCTSYNNSYIKFIDQNQTVYSSKTLSGNAVVNINIDPVKHTATGGFSGVITDPSGMKKILISSAKFNSIPIEEDLLDP